MSLVDKLRDRYGWITGKYPASVDQAIAQDPAHLPAYAKMREAGHAALRSSIVLDTSIIGGLIADRYVVDLPILFGAVIAGAVTCVAQAAQQRRMQKEAMSMIDPAAPDARRAMVDLEQRVAITDHDVLVGYDVTIGSLAGAVGVAQLAQDKPDAIGYLALSALIAAVTAMHVRRYKTIRTRYDERRAQLSGV